MPNATVRANAQALPEASQNEHDGWEHALRELEVPIYDLMRLLRAATHLIDNGDEDLRSSGHLIVELAAIKAQELDEQYQGRNWPGKRKDSQIEDDPITARALILQEPNACERQQREARTQAKEFKKGDVR